MSLNRSEQQLFDYIQRNPDERHYWEAKVRRLAAAEPDAHALSVQLDVELWSYLAERARVVKEFREYEAAAGGASRRISLRNLAEYVLRIWVAPKPSAKDRAKAGTPRRE